ncbi:MAG TPA: hypothetical protein VJU61_14850 [Polyangiaceae bacterium]|nr:hypothetical protein [Polyangiaceae bacterium]
MAQQEFESQLGVGRVVLGTARLEGATVASQRRGLNRKQDEEVVFEQGGDDRSLAELERDGDRGSSEALPELVSPGANGCGPVLQHGALSLVRTGQREAHVVLLVGPVNTDEGCKVSG